MDINESSIKMTPLPNNTTFVKAFVSSIDNPNDKKQKELAAKMGSGYYSGIGEVIYALITTHPDVGYAIVRYAQYSVCPHENHYHALRHLLKYLYLTHSNGIYYWRTFPNGNLPAVDPRASAVTSMIFHMTAVPHTDSWNCTG